MTIRNLSYRNSILFKKKLVDAAVVVMLIYKHSAYEQTTTILRIITSKIKNLRYALSYYSALTGDPTTFYVREN